jgi:hypothetical protein
VGCACVSVRRGTLYNNLIEFGIPMKLVRQIKMSLNETYSRVRGGKQPFDTFPENGLKQEDAVPPLLFNVAFEYAIRSVQASQNSLKLKGAREFPNYANDVNILSGSIHTINKNAGA